MATIKSGSYKALNDVHLDMTSTLR